MPYSPATIELRLNQLEGKTAMTTNNKDKALVEATRTKSYFPFRIHYIYAEKGAPDFWMSGCATTMRTPNALARRGATVELLTNA